MYTLSIPCGLVFAGIFISLIVIGLLLLAIRSNMLRDEINDPVMFLMKSMEETRFVNRKRSKIPRPFSLARTQLAFWTAIISSSYVYLMFYRHCGVPIHFDASTLAILGISMGTTMGGVLIDKSQEDLKRHQNHPSRNFFIDIVSDENGVSITRFQQLVWTVIAGFLYLSQLDVVEKGFLPSLDPAILTLSGLSSAAYLSLKGKENTGRQSLSNEILDQDVPAVTNLPAPAQTLQRGNQTQPK